MAASYRNTPVLHLMTIQQALSEFKLGGRSVQNSWIGS